MSDIEAKCRTTSDYNQFTTEALETKTREKMIS